MATKEKRLPVYRSRWWTPRKNGDVDYETFRAQIDFQVAAERSASAPVVRLRVGPPEHPEHERSSTSCARLPAPHQGDAGRRLQQHGRGPALTKWPRRRARMRRRRLGRTTQADGSRILRALQAIAEESGLQQCIYNIPGGRARISTETIARLADLPNITMVRRDRLARPGVGDSHDDRPDGPRGDDSLTLPLMAIAPAAPISVVGNIVPKDMLALLPPRPRRHGRRTDWHKKLFSLCRDMLGLSNQPDSDQAAMKMLGRDSGEMRLPMIRSRPRRRRSAEDAHPLRLL